MIRLLWYDSHSTKVPHNVKICKGNNMEAVCLPLSQGAWLQFVPLRSISYEHQGHGRSSIQALSRCQTHEQVLYVRMRPASSSSSFSPRLNEGTSQLSGGAWHATTDT